MIASAKSLRQCHLDLDLPYSASTNDECETKTWRNYFPHSPTPWHQLTALSVACTSSLLPLVAIIVTSGTITRLEILGSDSGDDVPRHSAFEDLWSAIEAYSASIVSFTFRFSRLYETSDIPPLDHMLPFLTSCTSLSIDAADLNYIEPLLSLTKLEHLTICQIVFPGSPNFGITPAHLLAFTRQLQQPSLLRTFKVSYDSYEFDTANLESIAQLKQEAESLGIDFSARGVSEY